MKNLCDFTNKDRREHLIGILNKGVKGVKEQELSRMYVNKLNDVELIKVWTMYVCGRLNKRIAG